jgi:hypothetical protein
MTTELPAAAQPQALTQALDDDCRLSVPSQAATPVRQAVNRIPAWIWRPHLDRIFTALDDLGCRELLEG